jgi:hypothetical protein
MPDKKELERYFIKDYSEIIKGLTALIEESFFKVNELAKNKPDWVKDNDLRLAIYGKYISNLNSTRILVKNTIDFINKENWAEEYRLNFSITRKEDDFVYLKEVDTHLRFASYINFISNFEATILCIIRFLRVEKIKCNLNYVGFIVDNLGMNHYEDFLKLISEIRNSIHNNGIYIAKEKDKENELPLSFKTLSFTFSKNKKIDLTWKHCLMIYEEIISFTEKIFEHEKIKSHILIKDIVVES